MLVAAAASCPAAAWLLQRQVPEASAVVAQVPRLPLQRPVFWQAGRSPAVPISAVAASCAGQEDVAAASLHDGAAAIPRTEPLCGRPVMSAAWAAALPCPGAGCDSPCACPAEHARLQAACCSRGLPVPDRQAVRPSPLLLLLAAVCAAPASQWQSDCRRWGAGADVEAPASLVVASECEARRPRWWCCWQADEVVGSSPAGGVKARCAA